MKPFGSMYSGPYAGAAAGWGSAKGWGASGGRAWGEEAWGYSERKHWGQDGKGRGKAGKGHGKGPGKGHGKGKTGKGGAANRVLSPGEFDWASAAALAEDPRVTTSASYSYVAKSETSVDVVSPAWPVRRLRPLQPLRDCSLDLSLARGLAGLQGDGGGFEPVPQLVQVLGLADAASAMQLAGRDDAPLCCTLLALKTIAVFGGERPSEQLRAVRARAEGFACSWLGVEAEALGASLEDLSAGESALPTEAQEVLRGHFTPHLRWSFFELWERLLSAEVAQALRRQGGFLCPRFFLVDLATAPLSPYDIDKAYPLVRCGGRVFVGQPPGSEGMAHDSMRQGRQLEASLVTFPEVEEDHVLVEVRLPRARAVFSAAPDAVEGPEAQLEPLQEGGYPAAGYALEGNDNNNN